MTQPVIHGCYSSGPADSGSALLMHAAACLVSTSGGMLPSPNILSAARKCELDPGVAHVYRSFAQSCLSQCYNVCLTAHISIATTTQPKMTHLGFQLSNLCSPGCQSFHSVLQLGLSLPHFFLGLLQLLLAG